MQSHLWQENPSTVNLTSGGQFGNDEVQPQGDSFFGRGSLGQFIERSTSAPPMSTNSTLYGAGVNKGNYQQSGNALVGSDLLQFVTSEYKTLTLNNRNHSGTNKVQVNNTCSDDEEEFGGVWLDLGDNNGHDSNDFSAIQSSAVGTINSSIGRPLSASGDHVHRLDSRHSIFHTDLPIGTGLMRSHSAAPSSSTRVSLGPPPGLVDLGDDSSSSRQNQHHLTQWGQSIRRPMSAIGLSGSSRLSSPGASSATLRPAAKTLMDLIQEDSTPSSEDAVHSTNVGLNSMIIEENNTFRSAGGALNTFNGQTSSINHGMSSEKSLQARYGTNEVEGLGDHTITGLTSPSVQYQKQQYSVQTHPSGNEVTFNGFRNEFQSNLPLPSGLQSQNMSMSHNQVNLQSHAPEQMMNHGNALHSNSLQQMHMGQYDGSGGLEQQYSTRTKQQIETTLSRQGFNSDEATLVSMYNQIQHQQPSPSQQISHMQHPQQQPVFFNGQRVEMPPHIHQQTMQNGGMQHSMHPQSVQGLPVQNIQQPQTIQLPNGQTVYVNTASPPSSTYGYATVQYHNPTNQQPHLIQQAVHSGLNEGGQYISVVSLPRGQQMTYWQPNGVNAQQNPLGISNPNGVTVSLPISGMYRSPDLSQQQQVQVNQLNANSLRVRDKAGARGKRGTTNGRRVDSKAPAVSMTSPLLEEFRASKSRDWTMRRIEGHVVEFCQDQNGSRFIQQRLEMGDVTEQQIVMNEVLPAIRRLRNDVFGNYVVQKLLDFGTPTMKAEIQNTLAGEMVQLSLQMYGCRVVQKALEALTEEEVPRLLQEFHHNVISSIHDQNGNHVIQKCIEVMNSRSNKARQSGDVHRAVFLEEQIDFIISDILLNTTTLACHPYGCRVLQRILEHCRDEKKKSILDEIKTCHEQLLDDQYGNYVIQHVLQFGRDEDRDSILEIVVRNGLLLLSRQKFASNVVEKLLKYGNGPQRCAVVREMLRRADELPTPSEPTDGSNTVALLMVRDAYANYVVQTTLDVVPESEEKEKLMIELNAHAEELRNYTFAKHIIAKLTSLNGGSQ